MWRLALSILTRTPARGSPDECAVVRMGLPLLTGRCLGALGGAGAVNPPIGQALADHAQQRCISTRRVVHAQSDAVGVAELELREVAVQVLLAAVLVDACHSALEQAERSFDGVGVDGA